MLRIWADFNSGGLEGQVPCWCLGYGEKRQALEDVAQELGLRNGLAVILCDPDEDFEVDGILEHDSEPARWVARADWKTLRKLKSDG